MKLRKDQRTRAEIGRVQIIRSVPERASLAICEPALMDTKMGSNDVKRKGPSRGRKLVR